MSYLGRRRKPQQRKAKNAQKRPMRAPAVWLDVPDCGDGFIKHNPPLVKRGLGRISIKWRNDAKDRKGWLTRLRDWLGL